MKIILHSVKEFLMKSKSIASCLILLSAVIAPAHAYSTSIESQSENLLSSFSVSQVDKSQQGKEIAEAILFASGDKFNDISHIPYFAKANLMSDNNTSAEVQDFIKDFLENIDKSNPGFFEVFYDDITSQDPYLVAEALHDLTLKSHNTLKATLAERKVDPAGIQVRTETISGASPQAVTLLVVVAAGVVVHVIVAVTAANVAAMINFAGGANWAWAKNWAMSDGSPAEEEKLVAEIASAFSEN